MKKRIIALFFVCLVIIALFNGCSSESTNSTNSETIRSETIKETVGSYYLFKTQDAQEYLNFLQNFDDKKYQIVDISTSLYGTRMYGSDEFYIITYKVISE